MTASSSSIFDTSMSIQGKPCVFLFYVTWTFNLTSHYSQVGNYKRAVKRIDDGHRLCNDLMGCLQERAKIEKAYGDQLTAWSKRWRQLIEKGQFRDWRGSINEPNLTVWIRSFSYGGFCCSLFWGLHPILNSFDSFHCSAVLWVFSVRWQQSYFLKPICLIECK